MDNKKAAYRLRCKITVLERFIDGKLKETSGNGVVDEYAGYTVNLDGSIVSEWGSKRVSPRKRISQFRSGGYTENSQWKLLEKLECVD